MKDVFSGVIGLYIGDKGNTPEEWDWEGLKDHLETILGEMPEDFLKFTDVEIDKMTQDRLTDYVMEDAEKKYAEKEEMFGDAMREVERIILLRVVDQKWMDHIDNMEQLRQSIGLQAYGQRDPLVEYRFAGYDMFDEMTQGISEDTVQALMHIRIQQTVEREEVAKVTGTNKDDSAVKQPTRRKEGKVYPNDPCPCGSGKKYKQCCGRKK